MYSVIKNVNILLAMLKKYNIRHIVFSSGTRNIPIAYSAEKDDFFHCYSIVDERSAAFFGIGLIQKLKEPVAICCTSGTAVCNYVSAVTEAYYQKLPLIVITADRNLYYLNQLEDQSVPQMSYFWDVTKKSVCLPIVKDEQDSWYCWRVINEALLEYEHHGYGPVHINVPIEIGPEENDFSLQSLPDLERIWRISVEDGEWQKLADRLKNKKILVIYGQGLLPDIDLINAINDFFERYDCVIATELISNLHCNGTINVHRTYQFHTWDYRIKAEPDIVISVAGNYVSNIKYLLKGNSWNFEHWLISEDGLIADPYKKIRYVVESTPTYFFKKLSEYGNEKIKNHTYYDSWKQCEVPLKKPIEKYTDVYVMSRFISSIPDHSLLHISNSTSIRLAELFDLKKSVEVYCNRGTNGIDGSLSAFMGNAVCTAELCFLIIGDLSFFYDMNGLWNRYVGKNIRILLSNNKGAGIFHYTKSIKDYPSLDNLVAAEHTGEAKGWVESRGFKYVVARNMKEFEDGLKFFFDTSIDRPVFFEVFTDKETDAQALKEYYSSGDNELTVGMKKIIGKLVKK